MAPAQTRSPSRFCTGWHSPVRALSSRAAAPCTTIPSSGTWSPARTLNRVPSGTSSILTTAPWRPGSARIATVALCAVTPLSDLRTCTRQNFSARVARPNRMTTNAPSKYCPSASALPPANNMRQLMSIVRRRSAVTAAATMGGAPTIKHRTAAPWVSLGYTVTPGLSSRILTTVKSKTCSMWYMSRPGDSSSFMSSSESASP
mmetsp:Transcript_41988/g.70990  ORF Transcript_41988/g.70990 Transcript_41988/m.70990 type:complete len:203 (+) Transcript_41988:2311-2919(+)